MTLEVTHESMSNTSKPLTATALMEASAKAKAFLAELKERQITIAEQNLLCQKSRQGAALCWIIFEATDIPDGVRRIAIVAAFGAGLYPQQADVLQPWLDKWEKEADAKKGAVSLAKDAEDSCPECYRLKA